MMVRPFTVLLLTFVAACAGGRAPREASPPRVARPPVAPSTPLPAFATTDALVVRPEVRRLVDELAATSRFASQHVSYDGHPSEEFMAFQRLGAVATDAEMIALLGHASPVVRSYAAEHVIERDLEAAALDVLLADPTLVETQYGCIGGAMSVRLVVAQSLCDFRKKPAAMRKLTALAQAGQGGLDAMASECLTAP
jgi:hypothetical protein